MLDQTQSDYALRVKGATKRFGNQLALDDVDFELRSGEVHCLAGENGSGKSTLIKLISGAYSADPGTRFDFGDGKGRDRMTPTEARELGVHVIWQDLSLFPDLTVAENICFEHFVADALKRYDRGASRALARTALDRLGVPLDVDTHVRDLSIAQRQIVAICRVLTGNPRIVFMDEPTASLTQAETDGLLAIVRKMSAQGISVVFVSHRLAEVLDISERVTVLKDGALVGCFPTEGMTQGELTRLMTGRLLETRVQDKSPQGDVVLRTQGLSRAGEFEDVSITIRKGEVLGLIGLLGAGRTELAQTLFGLSRPDAGRIEIGGESQHFRSNRDAIRKGIAYVSEDRLNLGLIQAQSITDNTAMTVLKSLLRFGFLLTEKAKRRLTQDWIDRLRTKAADIDLPVSALSGGNQQRVVLAKWLATSPDLLILDAPTVGVDVGARAGIFEIIHELAASGMAILLISDEASEVLYNAHRIALMKSGSITDYFDPAAITEKELEAIVNA